VKNFLVVEGQSDAAILRAVLPRETLQEFEIFIAGGRSSIASVARTLLVQHRRPLILFLDTDSLNPSYIFELYTTMEDLLRSVAGGTRTKVVCSMPSLEAIFFETDIGLKEIFPKYDPELLLMFTKQNPKEALDFLFQSGGGPKGLLELLERLTHQDIEKLQATYQVAELMSFALEVSTRAASAGA